MNWFKIHSLEYGWCHMRIGQWQFEGSNFLNYDMPRKLLQKVLHIAKGDAGEEWLYVMGEPGASILRIYSEQNEVYFEEYALSKESIALDREEIREKANCGKCWFKMEHGIRMQEVVDGLVTEFSLYETGNGRRLYEEHWGHFPADEYEELKAYAFELQKRAGYLDDLLCTTFLTQ